MRRFRSEKHPVLNDVQYVLSTINLIGVLLLSGSGSSDCLPVPDLYQQTRHFGLGSKGDLLISSKAEPATTDRKAAFPMVPTFLLIQGFY